MSNEGQNSSKRPRSDSGSDLEEELGPEFNRASNVAIDAAKAGELDKQVRAMMGIGSLAASALEQSIIRMPATKEPEVLFLDEKSPTANAKEPAVMDKFEEYYQQRRAEEQKREELLAEDKAAKKPAPRRRQNKVKGSLDNLSDVSKQQGTSTSTTGSSAATAAQKKEIAKLVKDLCQKEREQEKQVKQKTAKRKLDFEDFIDDYEDDDEMEEEEPLVKEPTIDSADEQRKLARRDNYKKYVVADAIMGRAQKLKLPRATINFHFCETCIVEHRKRTDDFLYNSKTEVGGNWGMNYIFTINCCEKCLDGNIQLGLLAQRQWKAEAVETYEMLEEEIENPFRYQLGRACATGDDKKVVQMKYCVAVFQCKECRTMQMNMAEEQFIRRGPKESFVLHYCLCRECLYANKEFQGIIYRAFNNNRFNQK